MTNPFARKQYAPQITQTDALNVNHPGPYSYHLGDIFTPGAQVWARAMNPNELLLQSSYGRGGYASVCCRKYSFDFRAQQVVNVATVTTINPSNGGVYVGTFGVTSLTDTQSAVL
jgi:hypothetical protein